MMENKTPGRAFLPIALFFIVSTLFILIARSWLEGWNMDFRVLLIGNGILFLATWISFGLYSKALRNNNIQAFLRMVYGSLLIKMVFCIAATLLYLFLAGHEVNKHAILGCFGLYIVYTFLEVKVLIQMSKKAPPKNA
jgi:hypothetical protein